MFLFAILIDLISQNCSQNQEIPGAMAGKYLSSQCVQMA